MRPFSVLFLGCFVGSVLSAGGSGMLNDMDMMKKWSKYKAQYIYIYLESKSYIIFSPLKSS